LAVPKQNWTQYVRQHLPTLGLRPERESDIFAELAAEFEQAYQEALQSGLDPAESTRRAEAHVKDWNALAAELRAANQPAPVEPRPGSPIDGIWQDVRYAWRSLRLNPTFAAIAVLTLAFGIGGNTAIFTVLDHIALRGLPYQDSSRLINIEHTKTDQPEIDPWCSIDNMLDFRKHSKTFASMSGVSPVWNVVSSGDGDTERLESLYVSSDFFPMLGAAPAAGRFFTPQEDDRVHPSPVAVLSYGYWTRHFGRAADAIGKTLHIDGQSVQVIGALPRDFRWLGEPLAGTAITPDLWMPLGSNQLARSPRTLRFLKVTGKLKPGVSVEEARQEVLQIGGSLTTQFPADNGNLSFAAVPLETRTNGPLRPAVYLLLATVGFVLLMASANVANLMLAKATARGREIAIRVALGATWPRIVRQLVTESAVLAALGGIGGLALAYFLIQLIAAYGPPSMLQNATISIDGRALAFTTVIASVSAILAGLVPAWRAISENTASAVHEGRGTTRGNRTLRAALSVTQVTIALVLLIGAGLLFRSLRQVLAVDPGFNSHNLISISTQVPPGSGAPQRTAIYNAIRDKLLATPGVVSVGAVSRLPMLGQNLASQLIIEGQESTGHPPEVEFRAATPSYFTTMGIPLQSGALFEDRDTAVRLELLIDSLTAQRYFNGADPVGKRIRFLADSNGPWFTIIGVVGTTRHFGLEADARPTIYRHTVTNPLGNPIFVIRTKADPASITPTLVRTVQETHGKMPAYSIFSMEQLVDRSTAQRRFLMWLITAFAAAALLLAGIGVYGAIAQSIAQRTREIGLRMALGAGKSEILRMVLSEGLQMAALGAVLGLGIGWAAARIGQKLLFQVQPHDPAVFAGAAATVLLSAALASLIPARKASRVDPIEALRQE